MARRLLVAPTMLRVSIAVVVLALTGILYAPPAQAYGPRETHRWLTRMAAEHLARAYPGEYDELLEHIDTVAEGAEHEDHLVVDGDEDPETLRVQRHFFRPVDRQGLLMEERGEFPSSLEWVRPNDVNPWHWGKGIDAYAAGNTNEAYFVLGHVAHLVQDLTVPAHTHLDIHPPPFGDDYENYTKSMMLGEHDSLLPVPPDDAPVPEFEDLESLWLATANVSFWRNRYPGDLSDPEQPAGAIAEMFPSLEMHWFYEEWNIPEPPIGRLGEGFFEDDDEPGWFYFKVTDAPALVDKLAFDPAEPSEIELAENPDGALMVELMAEDLVPLAILHSAAVMKMYLDEAYANAPGSPGDDEAIPAEGGGAGCAAAPEGSLVPWFLVVLTVPLICTRRAS